MAQMSSERLRAFVRWAAPGLVFGVSLGFAACSESLPPVDNNCDTGKGGSQQTTTATETTTTTTTTTSTTTTSSTSTGPVIEQPPGGTNTTSEDPNNTFDHFNDPGASGSKDPFEILKERAEEGPPEVRTRLHSCTKVAYIALGEFLTSRGVNLNATASGNNPKTAGQLYKSGADALGVAKFDAREGETFFHTTASATKLFDIFVQAAPEIIANIQNMDACKYNGTAKPMFDGTTGKCNYEPLSCIMGRPASPDDLTVCNLLVEQATDQNDLIIKRNIAVAVFLSAAHTCE